MDWIKALDAIPRIIDGAAKSPLGIFALMLIGACGLAFVFFKDAPLKARLAVFLSLLAGVAAFGISVVRLQNNQNCARAYIRAVAAFDQARYKVAVENLDQALASLADDNTGLTPTEIDGWRYYLLTVRSLWRAFTEDSRAPDLRDRTARHLRDAYTHWSRLPDGALPNSYLTTDRITNVTKYLCFNPSTDKYLRPEDVPIKNEACKRKLGSLAPPFVVALDHLPIPPAAKPNSQAERESYERAKARPAEPAGPELRRGEERRHQDRITDDRKKVTPSEKRSR